MRSGAFVDVVGRRSAVFGYEQRPLEVWIYPFKVLDELTFAIELEGYPLPIQTNDLPGTIEVRPEATTFTWAHAAFTFRQTVFAPIDEPAIVVLLDVTSVLPLKIHGSFRPRLRAMWPAGSPTSNVSWNADANEYALSNDSTHFAAVLSTGRGTDHSLMPYQEEPRDEPVRFTLEVSASTARVSSLPIVIAGSMEGLDVAKSVCRRAVTELDSWFRNTLTHYRTLLDRTVAVTTPDARLNEAFDWARVGIDKGFATNPMLGTGLLAGFRTSGNSERPGFAWFFGRDALWTSLALTSTGDLEGTRTALSFLAKHQREDGKIPHEISQSARLVPWFTEYAYAWASADATPLFVIAHGDYWRMSGDREFLGAQWSSVKKAYSFSATTDRDHNALIDNTGVGHGWVEGGALYPPHEELYLQALWIEASRSLAELAEVMGEPQLSAAARENADRTQKAVEDTYWIGDRGLYAFATMTPRAQPAVAEPGPARQRRQHRLDALQRATLVDEDTIMPAVPMWWRLLDPERADREIDRLGGNALATDWGHRILSDRSELYDPLSYHYGSVWPLFTGWASLGAYRYGRSHVGYQGLMANALLTEEGALGYVTELLSGDFNAAFGRSSHHQIWSEAMVITPLLRGLLGIDVSAGGRVLRIAPQLPADWDHVTVRNVPAGNTRRDIDIVRRRAQMTIRVQQGSNAGGDALPRLVLSPGLPLDARVTRVAVNGSQVQFRTDRIGDVQFITIDVGATVDRTIAEINYDGGSDVYASQPAPAPGARSRGVRVLRSRADATGLRLLLEGRAGMTYELRLRSPRTVAGLEGARIEQRDTGDPVLLVAFEGPGDDYVRREVLVRFRQ
jgi:glycogen debranching enzyme